MAAISIIKWSEIEGKQRIDAEYYHPDYLKKATQINQRSNFYLSKFDATLDCSAFYPSIAPLYKQKGIPFLRIDDIENGYVIPDNDSVFLDKSVLDKNKNTITGCYPGDIVIAKGGNTIAKVGMVMDDYPYYSTCRDLIIARTSALQVIDRYYLLAYLLSTYGQSSMIRTASQTGQPHLTLLSIRKLSIPFPTNKLIQHFKGIIEEAYKLYRSSIKLYAKAEDLFLSNLNLNDWNPIHTLTFIENYSNVSASRRADAEFFQPKFQEMFDKINNEVNFARLERLATFTKGIEVGSKEYTNEGYPFWRVSNLSKHGLENNNLNFISKDLYEKLKEYYEPAKGELLLSKDATPGVALYLQTPLKGVISSGILRLNLEEDILPFYLELVLNSIFVQLQIEQSAGGSIIKHWKPSEVKKTLIPRLRPKIETEICNLVQQSHWEHNLSRNLLENASRAVEIFIIDGEDHALSFLKRFIDP